MVIGYLKYLILGRIVDQILSYDFQPRHKCRHWIHLWLLDFWHLHCCNSSPKGCWRYSKCLTNHCFLHQLPRKGLNLINKQDTQWKHFMSLWHQMSGQRLNCLNSYRVKQKYNFYTCMTQLLIWLKDSYPYMNLMFWNQKNIAQNAISLSNGLLTIWLKHYLKTFTSGLTGLFKDSVSHIIKNW